MPVMAQLHTREKSVTLQFQIIMNLYFVTRQQIKCIICYKFQYLAFYLQEKLTTGSTNSEELSFSV